MVHILRALAEEAASARETAHDPEDGGKSPHTLPPLVLTRL